MTVSIVIADDHQLFIDGIKSILSQEIGIEIIGEANNGLELYKLVQKLDNIDLILSDIRMPLMDGIQSTRIISKEYPKIPIIALSMYDQESDVIEMLEAGAKGYLIKNSGKGEMLTAIHTVLNKGRYFSPELKDSVDKFIHKEKNTKKTLTRREDEIVELIAKGRTSLQIAQELNISKLTVDTHRKNIHKKLGIQSQIDFLKYVLERTK